MKCDFIAALRTHLEDEQYLPKSCPTCGAGLVYFDAQFRLYEDTEHFAIPIGFAPIAMVFRRRTKRPSPSSF
jgi:hypothetical protein